MIALIIGLIGACALIYSAVTSFTTLSALTQMGSIQERDTPWANLSRPSADADDDEGDRHSSPLSEAIESSARKVKRLATKVKESVELSSERVKAKVMAVQTPESRLRRVRVADKIVYTVSVLNIIITAYLLGAAPQYFYLWHTPKMLIYVSHRWWTFKQQGQHYLLYDFCYWANFLSLLYCWVFPDNETMFQIFYMVSHGPLAWSVLAFSQSLIFHSAPHMTSVFIHTSPAMLAYAIRWYPSKFAACQNWPSCAGAETAVFPLVWNAITKFYGWWVVLYYVWVYLIFGGRIKSRGYKTLFDRVISRGPTKFITKISKNEYVQKAAYMTTHFVFATLTMVLAAFYWQSWAANFVFILSIIAVSAWNASGFYFTVFLTKYEQELKDRAGVKSVEEAK